MSRVFGMVCNGDAELRGLARKYRFHACETQLKANKVALALVHRDKSESGKDKRQHEGQVVVVVHRTHQHGEHHKSKYETDTSRKNIHAPGAKTRDSGIDSLPFAGPLPDATVRRVCQGWFDPQFREWPRNRGHAGRAPQRNGRSCCLPASVGARRLP